MSSPSTENPEASTPHPKATTLKRSPGTWTPFPAIWLVRLALSRECGNEVPLHSPLKGICFAVLAVWG